MRAWCERRRRRERAPILEPNVDAAVRVTLWQRKAAAESS